jgi:asparagine synthase (glutamine-hydrolysing)
MSVQFGKCNFDGKPVDAKDLDQVRPVLARYGPDGEGYICEGNFGILYRAFHTTRESRLEQQPFVSPSGEVITWDGRLDNREELIVETSGAFTSASADISIVAALFDREGTSGFSKLGGDWALSIWNPRDRTLILAKDAIGTRPLYYQVNKNEIIWSSILDPLLLFAGKTFAICEEYIAGWFSSFPATHLSPFNGIYSVPPSSFVLLASGKQTIKKYWDFDPSKRILYTTDAEYEEHFRIAFAQAVRRKLRSEHPVLAELSGGMDSSSIVCVADNLIAEGAASIPRLDTLSYYNDSEPNWNERPYFGAVEAKRGRLGCHIDVSSDDGLPLGREEFTALPGTSKRVSVAEKQRTDCILTSGIRVVLSGIGGDEVTGGLPTPSPELADLLARADVRQLARQLKAWALVKRKPWVHLLGIALRRFLPVSLAGRLETRQPPNWLDSAFVRRNIAALRGYPTRVLITGPQPSFQENLGTLEALRRQIGCDALPSCPYYEIRYPYLERNFLEFLFALPRTQLVRPGQRRSLMRRALVGIVPDEILNRKRKAFVARAMVNSLSSQCPALIEMAGNLTTATQGIVDAGRFREILQQGQAGKTIPLVSVMRTLSIEGWLQGWSVWNQHSEPRSSSAKRFPEISSPTEVYGN